MENQKYNPLNDEFEETQQNKEIDGQISVFDLLKTNYIKPFN